MHGNRPGILRFLGFVPKNTRVRGRPHFVTPTPFSAWVLLELNEANSEIASLRDS
jgi:hypothetical protein